MRYVITENRIWLVMFAVGFTILALMLYHIAIRTKSFIMKHFTKLNND